MNNWRKILSWQLAYDHEETDSEGNKRYYNENNQYHNLAGPAVEWANGSKLYYVDGKLHRTDGPAIEWADGSKEYYVENRRLSEEKFNMRYRQAGLRLSWSVDPEREMQFKRAALAIYNSSDYDSLLHHVDRMYDLAFKLGESISALLNAYKDVFVLKGIEIEENIRDIKTELDRLENDGMMFPMHFEMMLDSFGYLN